MIGLYILVIIGGLLVVPALIYFFTQLALDLIRDLLASDLEERLFNLFLLGCIILVSTGMTFLVLDACQ
jgi:hypothetical protein